ncbi:AfsR/SARP family transcriptional regulator [Plantactinospora sp. KLBMP9567]|uniref:AfsR/SARP family transcriptional regulator n=1 Tax=Plantactinospora sp. KLBMP9567 TaxID=3085900 RepID=UPI0029827227|nr:BTAD domain-containing putative transcriptional regulator [Plantactinospora sp. KLBMP9567]MDW5328548.1 BTAD domain-containing putative transcriptional regulator [Plantactinospora sp. KLBMP9567]
MVEIQLLGPLQVVADPKPLSVGTPKQQAVLAMLAIRPGRMVTLEELIDELWPEAAPASAVANARGYAASLRRALDQVDSTRGLLARCGPGYQFRVRPDDVDLLSFEAECGRADEALASGDLSGADDLLRPAEQRWRGPVLSGVPLGPVLSARRTTAIEQRLGLVEQRAELCLATGRPRQAIRYRTGHTATATRRTSGSDSRRA